MKTNYRGDTGWFPILADRAYCLNCKEPLRKLHGLNVKHREHEPDRVMGFFLFDTGPYCIHHAVAAWTDAEFQRREGSSEYSARRWNLPTAPRLHR